MDEFVECEYLPNGFTVNIKGDIKAPSGKLVKQKTSNSGYLYCTIKKKGKFVHRAIAFAFLPMVEGKNIINHIDLNKKNNDILNLEWCTIKENNAHAYKIYNNKPPVNFKGKFGFDHNRSKAVKCIETGVVYGSQSEAQRELNMGAGCVCWSIKNKKPIFGKHFEFI